MTEAEWLASDDPAAMLRLIEPTSDEGMVIAIPRRQSFKVSERKLRLFVCACWRANPRREDFYSKEAYEAAEAADGLAGFNAVDLVQAWATLLGNSSDPSPSQKAALLRDILGNIFRPVTLPPGPVRKCPACDGYGVTLGCAGDRHSPACTHCGGKDDRPGTGKVAGPCPWITPQVLSLAQAAYAERGRECPECRERLRSAARVMSGPPVPGRRQEAEGIAERMRQCKHCHGTGRTDGGTLDPLTLLAVADALEEAGCAGSEACKRCFGSGTYPVQVTNAGLSRANGYGAATTYSEWRGCRHCGGDYDSKGTGRVHVPHPILLHLRSPGPHVRGCWALDCVLGRE